MISTKGRYAIRVMIDLAEHDAGAYIPLKEIAARQQISKKYLEIIVKEMVAGGLIVGASGKGGGYRLTRPLDEYNVLEILLAALVSGLTVGGKAIGKRLAIQRSTQIVHLAAQIIYWVHYIPDRLMKSNNRRKRSQTDGSKR